MWLPRGVPSTKCAEATKKSSKWNSGENVHPCQTAAFGLKNALKRGELNLERMERAKFSKAFVFADAMRANSFNAKPSQQRPILVTRVSLGICILFRRDSEG
jgi:hypothetical protein